MEPSTTQVVFTTLKGISLQVNFLQGLVHLKGANVADEGRDVVGQQLYQIGDELKIHDIAGRTKETFGDVVYERLSKATFPLTLTFLRCGPRDPAPVEPHWRQARATPALPIKMMKKEIEAAGLRTDDLIERPQVEARHKEASSLIGARAPYKITLPNGEVRPVCSAEEQAHAEEILARRRAGENVMACVPCAGPPGAGRPPLVTAVMQGQCCCVRLLVIDLGVDVNIPDTLGTTAVWLGCMRADPGIMQCLIFGGGDLTRACKSSLGKLETPVEVAWRYNRTDLFPLFAARGIEIPSGRPPQDLMESFISGMPTS